MQLNNRGNLLATTSDKVLKTYLFIGDLDKNMEHQRFNVAVGVEKRFR
jgi:hypothetical protein